MNSDLILQDLKSKLNGRLVLNSPPLSPSPTSSPCWNGLINHLPDKLNSRILPITAPLAYARCHSSNDVALSMQAAIKMGVHCYARSSGHQYSGMAFPSGGLVIDLGE
jgi:hypothetical protein